MNIISKQIVPAIAEGLHIVQGNKESVDSWCFRVIYSAVGLQMLASLYDIEDKDFSGKMKGDSVSMQHVLHRGTELFDIFTELYPDILKSEDYSQLVQNNREIYLRTGYMLHKNNYLTFPPKVEGIFKTIRIQRGLAPWNMRNVSGLGAYITNAMERECTLNKVFHIPEQNIISWWNVYCQSLKWSTCNQIPNNVEFIALNRQNGEKYWNKKLKESGIVLFRDEKDCGPNQVYGLLNFEDAVIKKCFLPSWITAEGEYVRISLALQQKVGTKNYIEIRKDGSISHIRLGYLLPFAEKMLFELLTWPDFDNLNRLELQKESSTFNRVIATNLLPIFRGIFINLGFVIKEIEND